MYAVRIKYYFKLMLFVFLLIPAACWVPVEQGQLMQQDILALRRQTSALKKQQNEQVAMLKAKLELMNKKLGDLQHDIKRIDKTAHRGNVDIGMEVDDIKRAIEQMRGEIELHAHGMQSMKQKLSNFEDEKAKLLASKNLQEDAEKSANTQKTEKKSSETKKSTKRHSPPKSRSELLNEAKTNLLDENYKNALSGYQAVLKKWPKQQSGGDRAYLGSGLAYAGLGDHRRAIINYNKILEVFPKSTYVDDALWQIAQSFIALGYPQDAIAFLEELITRHPSSEFNKKARRQIRKLNKKKK